MFFIQQGSRYRSVSKVPGYRLNRCSSILGKSRCSSVSRRILGSIQLPIHGDHPNHSQYNISNRAEPDASPLSAHFEHHVNVTRLRMVLRAHYWWSKRGLVYLESNCYQEGGEETGCAGSEWGQWPSLYILRPLFQLYFHSAVSVSSFYTSFTWTHYSSHLARR